ncbi:adenylyl-sulfate kinase [Trinickia dabaoshanensis]|uniref:Adenylyl-sulfate kinase n=1 Tax=Trinickia dabaoshanensis TaxID=564714 RepID=A0A2N7W057_9BURK|nr:adenylyl-sulfate kinase [Trinickia dabaoshanensis]PMS22763.1 adenylyl-sulfate kinase [Trinickia dabaoshanensis]
MEEQGSVCGTQQRAPACGPDTQGDRARYVHAPDAPANVFRHIGALSDEARALQFGHPPMTFWLTGLSGAGKSTIAFDFEQWLRQERRPCVVLDGDDLRSGLSRDLGFSDSDRRENIRRTAEVARMMNDAGLVVVISLVSPLRDDRAAARAIIGEARFVEVYVSTSLQVCEARDPKGLYRKARSGELRQFTGVSAPYETPLAPALTVDTAQLRPGGAVALLRAYLARRDASHGGGDGID